MPQCIKCKIFHYRDKDLCSFCEKALQENSNQVKQKKIKKIKIKEIKFCGRCNKLVKQYKRNKLCTDCVNEQNKKDELTRKWNERFGISKRAT